MKKIRLAFIVLMFQCALFVPTGHAHDPGLSRVEVQILKGKILLHLMFAQQDMDFLLQTDSARDERIGVAGLTAAMSGLPGLLGEGVELRVGGERVEAAGSKFTPGPGDAVGFELSFSYDGGKDLGLRMPVIAQLPLGHRQHLLVRDSEGEVQHQFLLSAASGAIHIEAGNGAGAAVLRQYFAEGVRHIWIGFDHILFLLTLLLPAVAGFGPGKKSSDRFPAPALVDILKVVTAFTLAHSLTLALAVLDLVQIPARLAESVIAFSVLLAAVNNLRPIFNASRWLLAFSFGLIHGFGFANVLTGLGLPDEALTLSLLGFNLGVEAGQLAIVAMLLPLALVGRHLTVQRRWLCNGASLAAAVIATVWMFERIFDFEVMGF